MACTLYDWPGMIGLCGAHEVTFWATLESSCECSRWSRIVALFLVSVCKILW
jgi:hypothetical protein